MHIQKTIEELGYTANEARVYLAALSLGEATVSDIALKVRLPRTSVQVIVDSLHQAGLMNFYTKKRYRYWVAENPEKLLVVLKERQAAVQAVLPSLSALRHFAGAKPMIKTFVGAEDIVRIHEDILAMKQPVRALISWDEWRALLGEEYLKDFIARRVEHFLSLDLLVPKTHASLELQKRDQKERRITRFLAQPDLHINTALFVYGTKVALISLNAQHPTAILIDDAGVAQTQNLLFEEAWKGAKTA